MTSINLRSFDQARRDPDAKGRRFDVRATGEILRGDHHEGISPTDMQARLAAIAPQAPQTATLHDAPGLRR